jgi:hypothetical protein
MIPQTVIELVHAGMSRWSVGEIAQDLAGGVADEVKKLSQRLLSTGVMDILAAAGLRKCAREIAKHTETVITEGAPTVEQRQRLAGAISANFSLVATAAADTHSRLCAAQSDLEAARGTAGESAARKLREEAEQRFVVAFAELGRLAPAGDAS